jgi:hypothetical protein
MSRLVQVVEVAAGTLLVAVTLADAIGTLVVARGLTARWGHSAEDVDDAMLG